jgi:hypothetical protein
LIDFIPPEPQIPVIAKNTVKDLLFQGVQGRLKKFHGDKDATGIEPGLIPGVNAGEVK